MKKNTIIIIIIVLVLLVGALFLITLLDTTEQPRNDVEVEITDNEEIINLIKSAYYEDGSIFCEFIEPGDDWLPEEKNHLSLKGGKIFVEVTGEHEDYYVIIKDGTVYVWSLEEETGLKFNMTEYEILEIPLFVNLEDPEAFEKSVTDYQIKCKQTDIDDSLFELPEGILFESFEDMWDMDWDMDIDPDMDWDMGDIEWEFDPVE